MTRSKSPTTSAQKRFEGEVVQEVMDRLHQPDVKGPPKPPSLTSATRNHDTAERKRAKVTTILGEKI